MAKNMSITWMITEDNVQKIIENYKKCGRKVDDHIAMIIFRNCYQNKLIEANYCSDVCDMYAADLWNMGAITE